MEPGHIIDPEILIRGRVEDRPGTPKRLALIAWAPPVRTAATNVYTGSFSGEAVSELPGVRQTWSGTVRLDAAQDQGPSSPPPNGGPRGSHRSFTATSGSIDVTIAVRPPGGGCALDGTGHFDLVPGFMNQVIVQLDVPNPAYVVAFTGTFAETVEVTRSGGAGCSGTSPWPVFSPWASTGTFAHTASSFALDDFQSVLTPEASYDYDYTTRWSLSPG